METTTKQQLTLLWEKAQKAGFTAESLRHLLTLLNLNPKNMSVAECTALLPSVNAVNARKFNY